jgi:hypothetical protein
VADTNRALDGRNVVIFRNASSGGALASTYSWTSGGSRVDSDIVFWDASYKFFTGTSGCSSGAYIEDVATHELGHSLGLGHSKLVDATMYSSYTLCSTSMRTPAADDLKGLQLLYPGTGGSVTNTAPSVTIASPANGATVTAGASTSFSGSASDSQQGNLTSQLVWRSNLSGQIGTGGSFTRALTAGTHTITATVTDSGGLTTQRSITVYAAAASSATAATLTATARTSKTGVRSTGLVWSGLISPKVDIYRNGAKIATKTNDGTARDPVSSKGTYTYKLCAQGTATCTNQASVTF